MDSLAKKIADAIGKYHVGFMQKKVLKTIEEIEATTDPLEKYIAGAGPVDELYNNLKANTGAKYIVVMCKAETLKNIAANSCATAANGNLSLQYALPKGYVCSFAVPCSTSWFGIVTLQRLNNSEVVVNAYNAHSSTQDIIVGAYVFCVKST